MPANSKVEKQILINAESWWQRLEQVVKITDKMGQIKHFVLHHEDAIKGDKTQLVVASLLQKSSTKITDL